MRWAVTSRQKRCEKNFREFSKKFEICPLCPFCPPIIIIEEVYKEHLRCCVGAFLMPETERRGAREKRIPGVPKGLQMRLGGMLRRHMLLYALCVPLHGDFGRCEGSFSY